MKQSDLTLQVAYSILLEKLVYATILLYLNILRYISMVILSFPLIQEGQLSVSGERMCTILVNHLED